MTHFLRASRSVLVACLVLVALLAAPAGPAGAAGGTGRMSIWRNGAFATQYLDASCVGATIQMTLNLIKGTNDHSKGAPAQLPGVRRQHSKYPVEDGGADPQGWVQALVHFGAGANWGWTTRLDDAVGASDGRQPRSARRASLLACSSTSAATPG